MRFIGTDEVAKNEKLSDFWVNIMSDDVQSCGSLKSLPNPTPLQLRHFTRYVYFPPAQITRSHDLNDENSIFEYMKKVLKKKPLLHADDSFNQARERVLKASKYKVGNIIELLDNKIPSRIRVARVRDVRGRRIRVKVCGSTYKPAEDTEINEILNEQQFANDYWIDEMSPVIFHIGWAVLSNFDIVISTMNTTYLDHAYSVAEAIKQGFPPKYNKKDAHFDDCMRGYEKKAFYKEFKKGMKLEFFDILDAKMNCLKIATILEILPNDYMLIGTDDSNHEEKFPIHMGSPFIFPAAYANKYAISIIDPKTSETIQQFDWPSYLKETKSKPAPCYLFDDVPIDVEQLFPVGSILEASCHAESHLFCPAQIRAIRGRLIEINYLGYGDEANELFDYRSGDIFPIGWAEAFGFPLIKRSNEDLESD